MNSSTPFLKPILCPRLRSCLSIPSPLSCALRLVQWSMDHLKMYTMNDVQSSLLPELLNQDDAVLSVASTAKVCSVLWIERVTWTAGALVAFCQPLVFDFVLFYEYAFFFLVFCALKGSFLFFCFGFFLSFVMNLFF